MIAQTFPIGARVVLTDEAKARPFWKSERWRNGVGFVLCEARGSLAVRMHTLNANGNPAGIPKVYYIESQHLRAAPGI